MTQIAKSVALSCSKTLPQGGLLNGLEAEIKAYITGLTTPLSEGQVTRLDNFVKALKTGMNITNLSDKFDYLYILCGETKESSLKNIVKNAHHATEVNNPIFTQHEGFTGVIATSGYLNTNYNPSTESVNLSVTNGAFGIYTRIAGAAANNKGHGAYDNTYYCDIFPNYDSNPGVILGRIASSTSLTKATSGFGLYGLQSVRRNINGNIADKFYFGGNDASTGSGLPNCNMYLLARNKAGTTEFKNDAQISFAYTSRYLTDLEHTLLNGAMNEYLFGLEKNVTNIDVISGGKITNDLTNYSAFGTIAKDSSNNLYVSYRDDANNIHTYSAAGKVVLRKSINNGITWSDPVTIADSANIDDRDNCILIFKDNNNVEKILVCWDERFVNGDLTICSKIAKTSDLVFSDRNLITADLLNGIRSTPILLSNNQILLPSYISVFKSSDYGITWTEHSIADAGSLGVVEATVLECKTNGVYAGKLVAIFRRGDFPNMISYSSDYGNTWSNLVDLDIQTNANGFLMRWDDSTILLFIGDVINAEQFSRTLVYKSIDEGDTWVLWDNWSYGLFRSNHHPSAVKLTGKKIAFNACNNNPGSDVYEYNLILDL